MNSVAPSWSEVVEASLALQNGDVKRIVIAHVAGVPVEEIPSRLASGVGAGVLLARVWVMSRGRRLRSPAR